MNRQELKDSRGKTLGYIETQSDGGQRLIDSTGNTLGYYDPRFKETKDSVGKTIGRGNLLSSLISLGDCQESGRRSSSGSNYSPSAGSTKKNDNRAGIVLALIAIGVFIVVVIFISPGLGLNWVLGRFAKSYDGLLWGSIKDWPTWVFSALVWGCVGFFGYRARQQGSLSSREKTAESGDGTEDSTSKRHEETGKGSEDQSHEDRPFSEEGGDPTDAKLEELTDDSAAQILGLETPITMQDARSAYRDKIAQYHPDKVAHLGPKLREVAELESKRINAAYEYLEQKFGNS